MAKTFIYLGISVGGIIGNLIGMKLSGGNALSFLAIIGSTIGSLAGIWAGVKLSALV